MIYVIGWLVIVTPFLVLSASWAIFKKAGFHPGLSIFTQFPVVNVILLYFVAFTKWPDSSV